MQPVARLLLNVGSTRQLLLRFLQRGELLLLTCDAAVQRGDLRPLAQQLTRGLGEREGERGDDHREHRSASSERGLAVARHTGVRVNVGRVDGGGVNVGRHQR